MPDIADENASLEDSRTTLVDTIERSTPESEADRSNIIETRHKGPCAYLKGFVSRLGGAGCNPTRIGSGEGVPHPPIFLARFDPGVEIGLVSLGPRMGPGTSYLVCSSMLPGALLGRPRTFAIVKEDGVEKILIGLNPRTFYVDGSRFHLLLASLRAAAPAPCGRSLLPSPRLRLR